MGNTITVRDIPEELTINDIRGGDDTSLLKSEKLDISLDEGVLTIENVPDCWRHTICEDISRKVKRALYWEDKNIVTRNNVVSGGDYIAVETPGGVATGCIDSVNSNGFVYISCDDGPQVSAPLSAVQHLDNGTHLSWKIEVADWVNKDAQGHNLVLEDGDTVEASLGEEKFDAEVLIDTDKDENGDYKNAIHVFRGKDSWTLKSTDFTWDESLGKYKVSLPEGAK